MLYLYLIYIEKGDYMGEIISENNSDYLELDYLNQLHGSSEGWITKATKNPEYKQWHYKFKDLVTQNLTGYNTYTSINTFYKTYRRIEYLKELNALFIDLDCYSKDMSKEAVLYFLENDFYNSKIPIPNFTIDSGRGLYLIFLINNVPYKALPLYKAIQDYLYQQLKCFGADKNALDCTRVLRVVGSVNTKSNSTVKILDSYDYKYDLREIQREFLPDLQPEKKKKGRPKKINFIFRERSLYYARIQDITKLCELRKYYLIGHRELILFLYRYYLCYFYEDTEKALQDTLELNSMFIYPVSENEATKQTRSAEKVFLSKDKQYKYKNETLIELLDIDLDEQKHMQTIISEVEYKRRKKIRDRIYQKKEYEKKLKSNSKKTKKQQIKERRQKIKSLMDQGFKQSYIADFLDVSLRTIKSDIKYLRESD
jgi:hypothetical protein